MRSACLLLVIALLSAADDTLLNVSFDATRELFAEVDTAFAAQWQRSTGRSVRVRQSHGGSSTQARAVIEGLQADVVSLALALDVDAIAKAGLLPSDWAQKQTSPWTSTVVLLVRAGNPKHIHDWSDLARADVVPLVASPKTSGAARLAYLAAWSWAETVHPDNASAVRAYMGGWLRRVPTFDGGARGATISFVRRGLGDVLLTWENEARLAAAESAGGCEVVVPSSSLLVEPPVAVVDEVVARKNSRRVAEAYVAFLASPEVQEIAARHHYRPRDPVVLARHAADFPPLRLQTVEEACGGWGTAQALHFADGGTFDQLLVAR